MATLQECEQALRDLGSRLAALDVGLRDRHAVDRTLSCRIQDLQADFSGRVEDGVLMELIRQADPDAQIRIALSSADLLALTEGRLNVATAWATGRLRIDASMLDLLKLRALL